MALRESDSSAIFIMPVCFSTDRTPTQILCGENPVYKFIIKGYHKGCILSNFFDAVKTEAVQITGLSLFWTQNEECMFTFVYFLIK